MLNSIHSASARPEAPPPSPRNLPSPSAVTRFSAFLDSRLEGAGLRKAEARERGLAFHPALQRTYGRVGLGLVAWLANRRLPLCHCAPWIDHRPQLKRGPVAGLNRQPVAAGED